MTLLDDVIAGATGDTRIASLLRQVKILASRTGADPLEDWIAHELDGYPEDAELPSYQGPFLVPVLGHFIGPFQRQMRKSTPSTKRRRHLSLRLGRRRHLQTQTSQHPSRSWRAHIVQRQLGGHQA
jgi:hypothetical protein